VKKLVEVAEPDVNKAMNAMAFNATNAIDGEVESTLSLARGDVWIDVSMASLVIVSQLYFIFVGLETICKEDSKRINQWADKLTRLKRRLGSLDLNHAQSITDLIKDTEELLELIGLRSSGHAQIRNSSIVQGTTCLFKVCLNVVRLIFLRDQNSVADLWLYGSSVVLNTAACGLSFWSATKYQKLKNEIDKSWTNVNIFLRSVNKIKEQKEEEMPEKQKEE